MIFKVGENSQGSVIVFISSNIEKLDEGILILDIEQYSALYELVLQGVDDIDIFKNILLQSHCEETAADMAKMMELGIEIYEAEAVETVKTYQRKPRTRIKNRIWQQAKSTLKYKRYELRIYGRKEMRNTYTCLT